MQKTTPVSTRPTALIILDGWGIAPAGPSNAISQAYTPNISSYYASFPHTTLEAAGESVGLPSGEAGNSEVGHLNLGSGRIVYQDLPRINAAISDGSFLKNKELNGAVTHALKNKSKIHLMGLVGSGGVHSSLEHLYALLWLIKQSDVGQVYLHLFTDGRDSPPSSALQIIKELEVKLREIKIGKVVTVSGRYYSMDRDNRWPKVEKVYKAMVNGIGPQVGSASEAIERSYKKKITDEFVEPTIILNTDSDNGSVGTGDSVIFFNFRSDRARQLTKAFVLDDFNLFNRGKKLDNLYFVSMTEYEKHLDTHTAFPAPTIDNPLAFVVSNYKIRQLHIGETEKYAHVTYFFNGGVEIPFPMEDRIHIPSVKIPTYDSEPEMSASAISEYVIARLKSGDHGLYIINFANADMVGHTGSLPATVRAISYLDQNIGKIVNTVHPLGGTVIIVGDHGNAEQMINPLTNGVDTAHSSNPVPFIVLNEGFRGKNVQLHSGKLSDVTPTILYIMGIPKPSEMTGRNLLV